MPRNAACPHFIKSVMSGMCGGLKGFATGALFGGAIGAALGAAIGWAAAGTASTIDAALAGAVILGAVFGIIGSFAGTMTGVVQASAPAYPSLEAIVQAAKISLIRDLAKSQALNIEYDNHPADKAAQNQWQNRADNEIAGKVNAPGNNERH